MATTVSFSGLASNIDTDSIVTKLVALQAKGITRLNTQKTDLQTKNNAYTALKTRLTALQTASDTLKATATYDAKKVDVSDADVLSATGTAGASAGSYDVTVVRKSTASRLTGANDVSTGAALDLSATLAASTLRTGVVGDAGGTSGSFKVNGVEISFDASVDSTVDVVGRINQSSAGVTALYDKFTDRFVLTNKNNGAAPITVEDVGTSNFLAATGLNVPTASNVAGQTAQVKIDGLNDGNPIDSNDDIFTADETGIPGLSLTLKSATGSVRIGVDTDTATIQTAFETFASAYNDVVKYINDQSQVTGSGTAKKVGQFVGDQSVQALSRELRSMLGTRNDTQPSGFDSLNALGIGTTGRAANISVFNAAKLKAGLQSDLNAFKTLMTDATTGIATQLSSYIKTQATDTNGLLAVKAQTISDRIDRIDKSIEKETRNNTSYETQLRANFAAMEQTISRYQGGLGQILSTLGQ